MTCNELFVFRFVCSYGQIAFLAENGKKQLNKAKQTSVIYIFTRQSNKPIKINQGFSELQFY